MKYGLPLDAIEFLLKRKENRTSFELKNGIYCSGAELVKDFGAIKFYEATKTDETKTLTIVYQPNISNGSFYMMWEVSEEQIKILTEELPKIYSDINNANKSIKGVVNNNG